jgi:phenylpyruvate tautomerase PptA (4-oxalocrotonate tautomerase family)
MPLVKIHLRKGKSDEYLRLVSEAVHEALVAAASAPADGRMQIFNQLEPNELVAHPSYGGADRTADLIVVEVTLNAGRTVEVKRSLYRQMARNLERAVSLRPDDLVVSLTEVSKDDWSFGKGLATYAQE